MRTISNAVEEVLGHSPFLLEALSEGIANNAEIARKIRPEIEKRLYGKVGLAAVAMAVHRLGKDLKRPRYGSRFLKSLSVITVRAHLVEFTFPNSAALPEMLEHISKLAAHRRDAFFNFSRGIHESLLIVDTELADEAEIVLKKVRGTKSIDGLSAIAMRLPEESLNVPGVYYPVLKVLALEGISFVEVMSVRTEFSIIFYDRDIDRAFSVIKHITG